MSICKRIGAVLFSAIVVLQLAVIGAAAYTDPMESILGVYEGYYYANQGQTGVTLSVYRENGEVKAIYEFYNLPNRTNAKEGSYEMTVSYSDGTYYFKSSAWIDHPSGYSMVDIKDAVLSGNVLKGKVAPVSGQNIFYAEKANDSYQQVQDSIFGGHRYEVLDEGMTWPEAEAYAEGRGGYLAVINSEEEQNYVANLISKGTRNQYWLGGYRIGSSFVWVNGDSMSYTNWDAGQPDNCNGNEQYMQMFRVKNPARSGSAAYHWNDMREDNTFPGEESFFSLSKAGMVIEYDPVGNASDWAGKELQDAYMNDLVPDVLIGRDLTGTISRGEFAAVACKLYEALSGHRMVIAMDAPFQDITNSAERLYILKAYNYSIVNGTSGTTYSPNDLLTREQMATMLTRVYKKWQWADYTIDSDFRYVLDYTGTGKFADDREISEYAYGSVYFMVKNGIINGIGDNKFAPKNSTTAQAAAGYANATRQQALLISDRTFNKLG